ncbi:G-type lectin S-receptor-like serine/threonine-protein kinase At4g03230 [Linum grandiflorum]
MGFDGRIQFFKTADETTPSWFAPADICSLVAPCGSFGSCNGEFRVPCKCLPGFVPKYVENWEAGDFSEGCRRVSQTCQKKKDGSLFLKLKVAKVQRETGVNGDFDEEDECREWCLGNCNCQGYEFDETTTACRFWTDDLKDIVEIDGTADGGVGLNVRVSVSDIELTIRDCKPCGTNTIPYPLSTGPTCGDPIYSSFTCNNNTGLLTFKAINVSYIVTRIDRQLQKFFIQVDDEYCTNNSTHSQPIVIELDRSLPFTIKGGCNAESVNLKLGRFQGGKVSQEMEIVWELPSEPLCNSEEDCESWPNSSCHQVGDESGDKRCVCSGNSRWDGVNATCRTSTDVLSNGVGSSSSKKRRELIYSIIFGILGGVLIISLFIVILQMKRKGRKDVQALTESKYEKEENLAFRLYDSEKRVKEFMNSTEFGEDDKKDIDVPFFDLECILSATDFFCNSNKLGQGGFGPVYKGKFPGGQEIAVKRLSSGSTQGLEEFKNEVVLIAKLQHRNLVRLLGFCVEGSEKMLLYEYMPNKSLDSFIFGGWSSDVRFLGRLLKYSLVRN